MTRRLPTALAFIALTLTGVAHAAEPEFTTARVVESREYDREKAAVAVGGFRAPTGSEWTSRVTVLLEGTRITGEWVPKTTISTSAEDFPRGSDVGVAVRRSQLLLKGPDGDVVTAKIVRRERQASERRD